jgi:hypothetical protein
LDLTAGQGVGVAKSCRCIEEVEKINSGRAVTGVALFAACWRCVIIMLLNMFRACQTRDNRCMPMVPTGIVHHTQLADEVSKAIRKLGKETVRVNYSMGTDSTGEPSIFFRIVLTEAASREDKLAEVTGRIETMLLDELHPQENWGLLAYFSFRSKSEQEQRNDPEWT